MRTRKVTIIGLGLIGGSLAMAMKKNRLPVRITGSSGHLKTIRKALKRRVIGDGTMDLKKAVANADIIFVCTPINLIINTLKTIAPHLKSGAIVTDVGSTKAVIVKDAERIIPKKAFFIGGHPMAGTEHTGLDAAFAGLFSGKPYILTPTKRTSRKALTTLKSLLFKLGAKVVELAPEVQDRLVAGVSHLPLAVAAALINSISGMKDRNDLVRVASSGFRDTTRVASGSPVFGVDLFVTNRDAVLSMIKAFKASLSELEKKISRGDRGGISRCLSSAKEFRDRIYKNEQF
jgi:prephenate dehydrogenase